MHPCLVFQVENSLRELPRLLGRPVSKSSDEANEPKNMNDVLCSIIFHHLSLYINFAVACVNAATACLGRPA
jgi:hypothetical protein